jgi:epoxyqueuosine reductase
MTSEAIKAQAQALGFDLCGVASAVAFPALERLGEWLDRGYAGEMSYLRRSADVRADIRRFLPTARSVIVVAANYYVDPAAHSPSGVGSASQDAAARSGGSSREAVDAAAANGAPAIPVRIARYAWGEDYHEVLAARMEQLVSWMRAQTREAFDARIFVDKHPVQERAFAWRAGLGWIGKNTCLIHPEVGSWLLLAGAAVSLDLAVDAPLPDLCGNCTLCIDACPTGALVNERELDATRCISYLTIEHRTSIPVERREQIGNHAFGCDICQEVCPYNLAPVATRDGAWQPRAGRHDANAAVWWRLPDAELHERVAGSAATRAPLARWRRNLAIAIGNSGDPRALGLLDRAGGGRPRAAPSAHTPLVEEHVAWARDRLSDSGGAGSA